MFKRGTCLRIKDIKIIIWAVLRKMFRSLKYFLQCEEGGFMMINSAVNKIMQWTSVEISGHQLVDVSVKLVIE